MPIHRPDTTPPPELAEACKHGSLDDHRVRSLGLCAKIMSERHDKQITKKQVRDWERSGLMKIRKQMKKMGIIREEEM